MTTEKNLSPTQVAFLLYLQKREDEGQWPNFPDPHGKHGNANTGLALCRRGLVERHIVQGWASWRFSLTPKGEQVVSELTKEATQ